MKFPSYTLFRFCATSCFFCTLTVSALYAAEHIGRDFTNAPLETAGAKEFSQTPLSVQARFKTKNTNDYNVIIAFERKNSPLHWELYTDKGGKLSLYAPGYFNGVLVGKNSSADDRWHEAAFVMDTAQAHLYLDGVLLASKPLNPSLPQEVGKALRIGELPEGGMNFKGFIDEVRIAKSAEKPSAAPWPVGEDTLALWSFGAAAGKTPEDRSAHARKLIGVGAFSEMGTPPAAPYKPEALAPYVDAAPLQAAAQALSKELGLKTVSFATLHPGVWNLWAFDYANYGKVDYSDERGGQKAQNDPQWWARAAKEAFDTQATIWPQDKGAAGTVLRRAQALADRLNAEGAGSAVSPALMADLKTLSARWADQSARPLSPERAQAFYYAACALRRQIAFSNPLLDFDPVLVAARGTFEASVRTLPRTSDAVGGHMSNQYFGFNAIPAGGLFVFKGWKNGKPEVVDLLKNAVVQNGRYKGRTLSGGAVATPDLSFDGKKIAFAWTANNAHNLNRYAQDTVFHIFTVNADGTDLRQITDGAYDDFDPCFLPNGRIAFISERRGGHIRCFSSYLKVRNYTLFSMKQDGSDIVPMSYFETSEWNPSVNNDGMLIYSRWDYVDRENCIGGRFWIAGPDGTNPRAPHGNYPRPFSTLAGSEEAFKREFPEIPWDGFGSRFGTPLVEMGMRAIPGSSRYVLTGSPHHGQCYGSLVVLDLGVKDDGNVSQMKRLTPDEPYPETEIRARSHHKYGTPWPLSEDFYLANAWEDVILLDRFGNREFLCGIRELPVFPDEKLRLIDPIPLRARPTPPVIPSRTRQGENADPEAPKATISVANVYETDLPLPSGVKIKWLRVVQNILKTNHAMGSPMIGNERENTPRIPLGIVPVEEDGSVYFKAPVGKELIFQLLDEDYRAVHSMRSVAFVFPGEQLSCLGCHEPDDRAPSNRKIPAAFRRPPSDLQPELGAIEPISYYRQIKPIVEKTCLSCHTKTGAGPTDLSYESFRNDSVWFSGGMSRNMLGRYVGVHGGSRTIPGTFGARSSKVAAALMNETHRKAVSERDRHTIFTWLDCNALRLGAFEREEDQLRGELVWPALDVDPANPQGVDGSQPGLRGNFWHENEFGPRAFLAGSHSLKKVYIMDKNGEIVWDYPAEAPQDVWMLPNGNVLFASLHAVREVTPQKEVVWEYKVQAPNETPTCQPLPDGNVLIGIVGECRLVEVNRAGEVVRSIQLQTPVQRAHAQFRMCRKTPEGTYLVPFSDEGAVREYNERGEVVRTFPPVRFPVCAVRLPDGNTLVTGDKTVTEFDPANRIVWRLNTEFDIPDIAMAIPAGVQRLPNGNTIVCNWAAADKDGKRGAHIFEVTPDKRVVWEVVTDKIGKVAQCQLLTDDFKPLKTVYWR